MSHSNSHFAGNFLVIGAAFVIVVAGAKSAAAILIPFLLSIFIAILTAPFMRWLTQHRIPSAIAVLILLTLLVVTGLLLGAFIGKTINEFYADMPVYEAKLQNLTAQLFIQLEAWGIEIADKTMRDIINPNVVMKTVAGVFNGLGGVLTNTFLILFTVVFILLEGANFPSKLQKAMANSHKALDHFEQFSQAIQQYLMIKTLVSLGTGAVVGLALFLIGVDYAALWALIAFLLNYIPNIGSIIAAVPAVLIALIQLGVGEAALTGLVYVAVNTIFGNLIEPRLMGRSLGLSTLVVFLSLIFWGWVFGPVGMLLSIPLTMMVKIALENRPQSRWIAVLLDA